MKLTDGERSESEKDADCDSCILCSAASLA